MNLSRFIALLSLLGLSFVSALMFESVMPKWYVFELFVICLGIFFSIIAVFLILNKEVGGWFIATLIFGAALVNGIVLFLIVKNFSLLILSIVVNLTGMIFSVLSAVEDDEEDLDVENYDSDKDDDLEDSDGYVEVPAVSSRKKKSESPVKKKRKYVRRK
jgi:hypothetical protein